MTGQVKEELLTRLGEFGLEVEGGRIRFAPELLPAEEILEEPGQLDYLDLAGQPASIEVPAGAVAFLFCQVPIVYRFDTETAEVTVMRGESTERIPGHTLPADLSADIFRRTGAITAILVGFPRAGA
jgi:hypothetical protein